MAEIHSIAGLGDRQKDIPVELSAPLDLAEQQNPADGHQGYANGTGT